MGRMSHETRLRVIGLWKLKYRLKDIQAKLQEEEIKESARNLSACSSASTRRPPACVTGSTSESASLSTRNNTDTSTTVWQRTKNSLQDT